MPRAGSVKIGCKPPAFSSEELHSSQDLPPQGGATVLSPRLSDRDPTARGPAQSLGPQPCATPMVGLQCRVTRRQAGRLTTGRPQRQEDDHGVHHQDVHRGCLPAAPAKEHLVLGLRLQETRKVAGRTGGAPGARGGDGTTSLTQLYTSSPSLLLRIRLT